MNKKHGETFDETASLYDVARPSYPSSLVADVVEIAKLSNSSTILEIGTGTGKATVPFACQGYEIHGLEPGKNLAAIAAKNLQAFPAVTIETVTFEDWDLQEKEYPWALQYNVQQYLNLLKTQSEYIILPEDKRQNLAGVIEEILNHHGGYITKPYVAILLIAQLA
ncbi:MAG: class I SAM-dependent methyltransferase [Nodosilinea sp.]